MEESISVKTVDINYWVEIYADVLFQYACAKIGDSHIAEDLVQETFLGALQQEDREDTIRNHKAWLLAILRNKIADYYRGLERKRKHNVGSYSEEYLDTAVYFNKMGMWKAKERPTLWNNVSSLSLDKEFCTILDACIAKLPIKYQAVVRLKIIENEKTDCICEDLEISSSNLWQMIHRTKLRLRKCINKHWFQS